MNCDANSLLQAATCLRCIPPGLQSAVRTKLLCEWANAEPEPTCTGVCWTPEIANTTWSEDGGVTFQTGDLATFKAMANEAAITNLDFSVFGVNITTLTGLNSLPNLFSLDCLANDLTNLDLSGCTALLYVDCSGNLLLSLNVIACTALKSLNCFQNSLPASELSSILIALDVAPFPATNIGSCDLRNQTTGAGIATLTPAGLAAYTDLTTVQAPPWTVAIDP